MMHKDRKIAVVCALALGLCGHELRATHQHFSNPSAPWGFVEEGVLFQTRNQDSKDQTNALILDAITNNTNAESDIISARNIPASAFPDLYGTAGNDLSDYAAIMLPLISNLFGTADMIWHDLLGVTVGIEDTGILVEEMDNRVKPTPG